MAQRWRRGRSFGTLLLAAAGPLISLAVPATSELVAAISAGWLVLGRTLLAWLEHRDTLQAVRTQELYDTNLFRLPWNTALAGRKPSPDDVAAAARRIKSTKPYLNWYSIDLGDTPWPADVVLCQRQSMVWGRRDHRAYAATLLAVGAAWFFIGLAFSLAMDLSLADYLIKIFLPSAPAFLDAFELARSHWRNAAARERVENDIHDLWQEYHTNPADLPAPRCRSIQDAAFLIRHDGPRVPKLFYKLRKKGTAAATDAGTAALRSGKH